MRSLPRTLPPFLAVCAALLLSNAPAQERHFSASLDGAQEVPPVRTSARGWAVVVARDATRAVDVFVHTEGLRGAVAAHLHRAAAGANGPVILPLRPGAASGTWTGAGTLSTTDYAALRAGNTYVNVHTRTHAPGEIRGQVVVARTTAYAATLDGRQEVPPNRSTATGSALVFLHEPDGVLTYDVRTRGLANVTAAHIHMAPAGRNGPVIHGLRGSAGRYCGATPKLTAAQLAALKAGGLYFNVHTARFPGGEIRGQIRPLGSLAAITARLDGAQEVPPVRTKAIGYACLSLNPDATVDYLVVTKALTGAFAAHVHRAPRGRNGGIVFGLSGGPTVWRGTSRKLTAAELADARAGLWYVNVHTSAHRSGEIRGQLAPADLPSAYGGACPGNGGTRAEIGARSLPCPGDVFVLTLHGASANRSGAMLFGARRARRPIDLAAIGMRGCYLLIDGIFESFPFRTDTRGCTEIPIRLPADPGLAGIQFTNQAGLIDPGATALGIVTSNALVSHLP